MDYLFYVLLGVIAVLATALVLTFKTEKDKLKEELLLKTKRVNYLAEREHALVTQGKTMTEILKSRDIRERHLQNENAAIKTTLENYNSDFERMRKENAALAEFKDNMLKYPDEKLLNEGPKEQVRLRLAAIEPIITDGQRVAWLSLIKKSIEAETSGLNRISVYRMLTSKYHALGGK